jgi:hypothetical protein
MNKLAEILKQEGFDVRRVLPDPPTGLSWKSEGGLIALEDPEGNLLGFLREDVWGVYGSSGKRLDTAGTPYDAAFALFQRLRRGRRTSSSLPKLPPGYRWRRESSDFIVLLGHGDYEIGWLEGSDGLWAPYSPEGMRLGKPTPSLEKAAEILVRWKDS